MRQLLSAHKLNLILGMLLCGLLVGQISTSQAQSSPQDEMIAYIEDKLDDDIEDFEFSEISFEEGEDPNIYMILFNEIEVEAENRAQTNLITQGYTSKDLDGIIQGQNTQANLAERYNREKDFFRLLAEQSNETLALELFSNGSTADAEFDLLTDLNEIEALLFQHNQESQFGPSLSSYSNPTRTLNDTLAFEQNTDNNTDNQPNNNDTSSPNTPVEIDLPPAEVCQIDPEILDQLRDYNNNNSNTDTDPNPDADGDSDSDEQSGNTERKSLTPLLPREDDCEIDDIFCFKIETIYRTEPAYFPPDDCVACIIEDIAAITQDLVSEPLTPHKVTGNLFEPNLCKEAFSESVINIRVNLVERPIFPSDPLEELIELTPSDLVEERNSESSPEVDDEESVANSLARDVALGIVDNAQDSVERAQLEAQRLDEQRLIRQGLFTVNQDIASQSILIQDLHSRMQTMNIYIDSINGMLTQINGALQSVSNKNSCSAL